MARISLGTSGWSYADWIGPLYPPGTTTSNYLAVYARSLRSVEIDSTFYRVPSAAMLHSWRTRTPEGFVFAAKVPRSITHDAAPGGPMEDLTAFIDGMRTLGEKCGPLLFQFPPSFSSDADSGEWLESLLEQLPPDLRFAVEVRHRSWLRPAFFDLLRRYNIALAQVDLPFMPRDTPTTADWAYIRWLGDRQAIQEDFSSVRLDRREDLEWWAGQIAPMLRRGMAVYGYANNHYQGYAPATIQRIQQLLGLEVDTPAVVQEKLL